MSKENNLKDYLTDLYEGIVSKKPDASKNPQHFRREIEGIAGGTNGLPIKVSTQSEIDALAIGTIFKYTGESGTYENGALYIVEAGE